MNKPICSYLIKLNSKEKKHISDLMSQEFFLRLSGKFSEAGEVQNQIEEFYVEKLKERYNDINTNIQK